MPALVVLEVTFDELSLHGIVQFWIPAPLDFDDRRHLFEGAALTGRNGHIDVYVGAFAPGAAEGWPDFNFPVYDHGAVSEVLV